MERKEEVSQDAKKRLYKNVLSLLVLRGANYLLPLITLPYLVRVLGVEKFGLIMFAQSFTQQFIHLTDYGFDLSATRQISRLRENKQAVATIFHSVLVIKTVIMFVCLAVLTVLVFSFDRFREEPFIYFTSFGLVVGSVLFPVWFFQGLEQMRTITQLNIFSKSLVLIAIFSFIHEASDYRYVPMINSFGLILAGACALCLAFRKVKIGRFRPTRKAIMEQLRLSTPFFLSRVSAITYTSSNTLLLGLVSTNQLVGYYAGGEKLYMALRALYEPLNSALYPFMSRTRAVDFYKKVFWITIAGNTAICLAGFFFAAQIVSLVFGPDFHESVPVFRIFAIGVIFVVPAFLLGYPFLAALGHAEIANNSVIIASAIHLIVLILLATFSSLNLYTLAAMVVITEFIVFSIRAYGVIKHKLWSLN